MDELVFRMNYWNPACMFHLAQDSWLLILLKIKLDIKILEMYTHLESQTLAPRTIHSLSCVDDNTGPPFLLCTLHGRPGSTPWPCMWGFSNVFKFSTQTKWNVYATHGMPYLFNLHYCEPHLDVWIHSNLHHKNVMYIQQNVGLKQCVVFRCKITVTVMTSNVTWWCRVHRFLAFLAVWNHKQRISYILLGMVIFASQLTFNQILPHDLNFFSAIVVVTWGQPFSAVHIVIRFGQIFIHAVSFRRKQVVAKWDLAGCIQCVFPMELPWSTT